ncbi:MAG: hydrolase [Aerococcus sp.]|nr:hydrolase [Aerococcus sp.]
MKDGESMATVTRKSSDGTHKSISTELKADNVMVPEIIEKAPGIRVFGKRLRSFLFSTDIATICYTNADAILAVYPYTPHPAIISAIVKVANQPVFAGVGGGKTNGRRSIYLALTSEAEGASGVVVNVPMSNENITQIASTIDSPIIGTVVSEYQLYDRHKAGVDIFNISAGKKTPYLVERIRKQFPDIPIIATGGKSDQSILDVIDAGADAINWTPPTTVELFRGIMDNYRTEAEASFREDHEGLTLTEYEKKYQ